MEKIIKEMNGTVFEIVFDYKTNTISISCEPSKINLDVNNERICSVNQKNNMSKIPDSIQAIIPFVDTYEGNVKIDKNNNAVFDLTINNVNYVGIYPVLPSENSVLKINNWLNNIDKIMETFPELKKEKNVLNRKFVKLEDFIKKQNFEFEYSHDGDMYDDVYSLLIPRKNFDMDTIIACCKKWEKYNEDLNKLINIFETK